jgi:ACS family hexuronate transporter-like MFS transporter
MMERKGHGSRAAKHERDSEPLRAAQPDRARFARVPEKCKGHGSRFRWIAVSVFLVSSTLNYLDRQLLVVLAPLIIGDLHLDQTRFGLLISAFSIAYAASSLLAGWFLDRVGVNRAMSLAVAWWSAAATCTAFARSIPGLAICRAALGIGESAGVPAFGKVNGIYLEPEERALGAAANQIGLSLGSIVAPLWIGVAVSHGWRLPFVVTGLIGFIWIPLWLGANRSFPPRYAEQEIAATDGIRGFALLKNRSLILLVVANVLWMGGYSLWSNWTTLYLVHVHHLTLKQTASYVWIPPLISNLGGFFGGWLSLHWIRKGRGPVSARCRAVVFSALGFLLTLLLPLAPTAAWATAIISVSFFFSLSGSVNIYALPIDLFGPARAGLAVAALTCSFGILQTAISPLIGFLGDHQLYTQVVWVVTVPLLLALLFLKPLREPSIPVTAEL